MRDSCEQVGRSNRQTYRSTLRELRASTDDITDNLLRDAGPLSPLPSGSIDEIRAISGAYSRTNWLDRQQLRNLLQSALGLGEDVLDSATELLALRAGTVRTLVATGNPPSRAMVDYAVNEALERPLPRSVSDMEAQVVHRKKLAEVMDRAEWQALVQELSLDTRGLLRSAAVDLSERPFVPSFETAIQESLRDDIVFLEAQARALDMSPSELADMYTSIARRTGAASNRRTLITGLHESEVNESLNPTRGQIVCARGTFSFGYYTLFKKNAPFRVAHDFYGVAARNENYAPGETSQVFFPRLCLEGSVFAKLTAHPEGSIFLERLRAVATLTDHDYLHVLDLALAFDIASSSNSYRLREAALRLPLADARRKYLMDHAPHKRSYEYEIMYLHREALKLINSDGNGQMWKQLHEHFVDVCVNLNVLCKGGVLTEHEAAACLWVYCNFSRLGRDLGRADIEAQRDCLELPTFDLEARLARSIRFDDADPALRGASPETVKRQAKEWFVTHLEQSWALIDRCLGSAQ